MPRLAETPAELWNVINLTKNRKKERSNSERRVTREGVKGRKSLTRTHASKTIERLKPNEEQKRRREPIVKKRISREGVKGRKSLTLTHANKIMECRKLNEEQKKRRETIVKEELAGKE